MEFSKSYKILSVVLALLVLVSTLSITVEKHYCGSRLVDVAVFTEVQGCGMESKSETTMTKSCCKDVVDVIEGQDELNTVAFDDLNLKNQLFVVAYIHVFVYDYESLPKQIIPHKDYSPPNIIKDIQLLDDVFLI